MLRCFGAIRYDEFMQPITKYEGIALLGVMVCFLLLTFAEPLYALSHRPEHTTYTYVHNHPEDYYYFLHIMRQGYDGAWQVTSRMTPEEYPPRFVVPFFVILGKVGRIVPLGMAELYTLARLIGAIALMVLIYRLTQELFTEPSERLGAFIVTLAGTSVPIIQGGTIDVPILVRSTWTELDPLIRLSFVPHHLWSKVLFVTVLLIFVRLHRVGPSNRRWRLLLWLTPLFTLCMGFISPVIVVTYLTTITLWTAGEVWSIRSQRRAQRSALLLPYILAVVAASAVSLYHWQLAHSVFPWTTYGPPWENNWLYLTSAGEYIQSFGVLFPVAIVGAMGAFRSSSLVRMLVAWVLSGWLLIFVLRPFLPFSNSRYLAGYQWIAVGLLAAVGISYLSTMLARRHHVAVFVLASLVFIVVSVPSWYVSLRSSIQKVQTGALNPQMFTGRELRSTLFYLDRVSDAPCIVAAPDWFSTMIPAYTSCRAVSGHRLMTYANDVKVYEMNQFFYYPVSLRKKEELLKRYRVTHVVTLEGITGEDFAVLLAPTPAFTSGGVRVYETKPARR